MTPLLLLSSHSCAPFIDANSEPVHSGVEQTSRSIISTTTNVQQTGQSTTGREGAVQRQQGLSSSQRTTGQQQSEAWTQDELQNKRSFRHETPPTVSASTAFESRHFTEHHTEIPAAATSLDKYAARALEEKEGEIRELRQNLAVATSRNNDLEKSQEVLSSEVSALRSELGSQYKGIVASLSAQVNQLKVACADKTGQLADALSRVRELRLEVPDPTAQFTELQGRSGTQLRELISANKHFQAVTSNPEKTHVISSPIAEKEKSLDATKAEQITGLKQELSKYSSQVTALQHGNEMQLAELRSLRKRLKAAEGQELLSARRKRDELHDKYETLSSKFIQSQRDLAYANMEIKRLRQELNASPSRVAELQRDFTHKINYWQKLDATKVAEYQAMLNDLNSHAEQWNRSHGATGEELEAARDKIQRLQHDLDVSSSRVTQLQQQFDTEKSSLKVIGDAKDNGAVIQLTAELDEWISTRPEYEDLRHKLISMKETYVSVPQTRENFQLEATEIKKRYEEEVVLMKRRYEEESEALKTALADSQSQLRDVHRVVATADVYADEAIIQMLRKLNAEVQQTTTLMADSIAEQSQRVSTRKATKAMNATMERVSESIGQPLAERLTDMKHDEAPLYLSIAFQACLSCHLCQLISSWTIEKGHNDFIDRIYQQLKDAGKKSSPECHRHFPLTENEQKHNRCRDAGDPLHAPTSLPT